MSHIYFTITNYIYRKYLSHDYVVGFLLGLLGFYDDEYFQKPALFIYHVVKF